MEIVNISFLGSGQVFQDYQSRDENLITSNYITPSFGTTNDYVEFFIYDENNTLIDTNYLLNSYKPYQVDPVTNLYTAITVDPELDLKNQGYNRGKLKVQYNFLRRLFNSSQASQYWIKEISPSRTELKLSSQDISNIGIQNGFNSYQVAISSRNYYNDFYLNFSNNQLVLSINAAYTEEGDESYLLVKLYQPLPFDFDLKSTLWIVEKAAESVSYEVDIQVTVDQEVNEFSLRGPNFNVQVNESIGQTTPYYTYNKLFSSDISSSIQQLKSWYEDKAIRINVDYSNFENFVHFSSATERVNNFVYKLGLIESYNQQIKDLQSYSGGTGTALITSSSIVSLKNNIDKLIEKFDTYEYYLYYSSESFSWPKYNNTQPYLQVSVTSSQASNWLGSATTAPSFPTASVLFSASYYDSQNQNRLVNSIPNYLVEDDNNAPYITFLDMIGQHFDNIWLYYKDVSNRFDAANNPNKGVSKDLVADALRSLGAQIYTNSTISNSVYFSLFGINPDGSLLPPTGSEMITSTVTSSIETLASDDVEKEIYKRIYHNLPYLLKSRGTERGIKALLSCYGIPESILDVKEFGGYDITEKIGILESNEDKIRYYQNPLEISSSFLSPFSTLQYHSDSNYINSTNLEVAFSPADLFNAHITSSLTSLNLQALIASPGYLLSSSYQALDFTYATYLKDYYVKRFNLWDYVRLVKYYNNSVFKMIKDFVPARSNISTGIVIKDHILHRNKYARHEPEADNSKNFSQSIDIAYISADAANSMSGSSTSKSGYYTSSLGYIPFTTTDGIEKYTGDFQGGSIEVTSLNSFNPQIEYSIGPNVSLGIVTQSLVALYQNVSQSLRSRRFFDLDYSYQQNVPVNFDLISMAVSRSMNNPNWQNFYSDPYAPFAYLQDYNYNTNAFTIPRYFGSKTQSSQYTYYVQGESGSYGNTAAIDKIKYQFAYLVDIYTASLILPGRSNSQIKYIIDNNQTILDLTKRNDNIFFTQNVFKSGEYIDISLFDYNPQNPDIQILTNKKDLKIYEGGWRYSPVLFSINGGCVDYKIEPPLKVVNTTTTTTSTIPESVSYLPALKNSATPPNANVFYRGVSPGESANGLPGCIVTVARTDTALDALSEKIYVKVRMTNQNNEQITNDVILEPGQYEANQYFALDFTPTMYYDIAAVNRQVVTGGSGPPTTVTTTTTTYLNKIADCDNGTSKGVYVPYPPTSSLNQGLLWLSVTQSLDKNYGNIIQTSSYAGIETPTFPISFQTGDMVKLKDQKSRDAAGSPPIDQEFNWWPESEEYRVVRIDEIFDIDNNKRIQLTLDRPINPATVDNYASTNVFPSPVKCYILNKHIPDETNIILRYSPQSNITEDGVFYPQYLSETDKTNAGNTIKSLKSQNLI